MASSTISTEELEYQLEVTKADVAELQAAGNTSAAAAYFTIQATLERFLGIPVAQRASECTTKLQNNIQK